jgi:glycosyltransferase involved in cell wall biosynthesis
MRIVVNTVCFNEEKLLPFFLDYYARWASKIVIWDNFSNDATVAVARAFDKTEVVVRQFDTGNEFREDVNRQIKNTCWKDERADWIIVCDVDEFLHVEDLPDFLARRGDFAVFRPLGYNMVSTDFPSASGGLITGQIKRGSRDDNYSKMVLFDPTRVETMDYSVGAHRARPIGRGSVGIFDARYFAGELKLLHYKNISFAYRYSKNLEYAARVGAISRQFNWNFHFGHDEAKQRLEFEALLASAEAVIG